MNMKTLRAVAVMVFVIVILTPAAFAGEERHGLTFMNRSGDAALVKLVGPSRRTVPVAEGQDERVQITAGTYYIYVRYGAKAPYRYTKGETFQIEDPINGYVEAQLTLHGVAHGNYSVGPSSEDEFNRH